MRALSKQVWTVARIALYKYKTSLTIGVSEREARKIALDSIWFSCEKADATHRYRAFKRFGKLRKRYD